MEDLEPELVFMANVVYKIELDEYRFDFILAALAFSYWARFLS